MGVRFNKRIKIAKGVSLNVSKRGLSTSVKVGRTTLNSRGRITTNFGNGFSHQVNFSSNKNTINGISRREAEILYNELMSEISTLEIRLLFNKLTNFIIKGCCAIICPMSLLLSLVFPFMILVSIITGYIALKVTFSKKEIERDTNELNRLKNIASNEYAEE